MASPRGLNYYKSLNYRIELFFDSEDRVWYAEFPDLSGCLAHGTTKEEALANAVEVKDAWLEVTFETGRNIPEPRPEIEYSGRFLLRVPKSLHQKLADEARREGTSINRLAIQILSEELERRQTMKTVRDSIQVTVRNAFIESKTPSILKWFSTVRSGALSDQVRIIHGIWQQESDVIQIEDEGSSIIDQGNIFGLTPNPAGALENIRKLMTSKQVFFHKPSEKSEEDDL